jgi:3-oxoacyl-[acyl-carrier-protein] synthase II
LPEAPGFGRATRLALAASERAFCDAALDVTTWDRDKGGVSVGSGHGETGVLERQLLGLERTGASDGFQEIVNAVAHRFGLHGPAHVVATACASGLYATLAAADRIRSGDAEVMLAGGTEALAPSLSIYFNRLFQRAPDICRPFDRHRRGTVLGEGAAMVVLESEEHAARRGARALAVLAGGAVNCDAYDVTGMRPERMADCIRAALDAAELAPSNIDHLSAHGSGTRINDANEANAIKAVYGQHARHVAITAIKSMLGHTSGASGAIALVAGVLSIVHGVVPPTPTLQTSDPECDLDFLAHGARTMRVGAVQVNAFGFGGSNASLIVTARKAA